MNISKELLDIILILTPGIISYYLIEALTHHKRITYQRVLLNIIVLNFIIYFLIYLFTLALNKHWSKLSQSLNLDKAQLLSKDINISIMALGLIFAILIGIIITRAINQKYLFKLANKLKVSSLSSNLNVWDDFLSEDREHQLIVIRDISNNLIYVGLLNKYSEFSLEQKEIHLTDVEVFGNTQNDLLYKIEELYLVINDTMTIEIPILTSGEQNE